MAKANVILLNSILWNLREISKLADEIKGHCGDVECASWRYPLTDCGQLEIFKLLQNNRNLDNYTYILELTYDRILYVFNLIIKYMESHGSLEKFRPERNVSRPKTLSLASVLCMIWERIKVQMEAGNASIFSMSNGKGEKVKDVDVYDTEIEIKISKSTSCTQSDVCSISVCSCCQMVQEFVTQLVLDMEKIVEKQDFESAIGIERKSMKKTLVEMTNWSAMSRWLEAIVKDFNALSEKSEKETLSSRKLRTRIDADERKTKMKMDQYEEEIRILENRIRDYECKLSSGKATEDRLLNERNQMKEEIKAKNLQMDNVTLNFENKIRDLRLSYETKILKLKEKRTKKEAEKDREWKMKFQSEIKRREIIELEKQKLEDALCQANKENSAVSERKSHAEIRCESLEKDLENVRNEILNLQSILNQKQTIIDDYSKRITEAFPQLNDTNKRAYKASGNPETDMANQIEANRIRMELIRAENEKLQKALDKMKALKG